MALSGTMPAVAAVHGLCRAALDRLPSGGSVTAQPESDGSGSAHPGRVDTPVIATADNPPPDQWLIVALEEYKSLRIEIVDAIEAQRKIMQLGVTALSVLIGLGSQQINPFLAVVLLTLLVPTVAIFITAGALGERFRASRASYFLARREEIVNEAFAGSEPALAWEKWIRGRSVFILRDRAEFFAVFSLTTASLSLGSYTLFTTPVLHVVQLAFIVPLVTISLALWITCIILHFYMIDESRREFLSGGQGPRSALVRTVDKLRMRASSAQSDLGRRPDSR